jgi:single-stranded-DNA-specific exonuclease
LKDGRAYVNIHGSNNDWKSERNGLNSLPKRWNILPPVPDEQVSRFPSLPRLTLQLLYNRGIVEPDDLESFQCSRYCKQADPFLLKDMGAAVDRLERAISERESIAIYGDYDVDGVTASSLLVETLALMGAKARYYIPHRVEEGYGLNCPALKRLADEGAALVVTVDCGIASVDEVEYAKSLGLDIIVTDHHSIGGPLPAALAVINPKQADCQYPFKDFAGVGVAYQLVRALAKRRKNKDHLQSRRMLDLVALGTVADVVPLLGENRILVKYGLRALQETTRPGLKALIARAGLNPDQIDSWDIAFLLAPRLNAAGRMDHARIAYELLTCETAEEGDRLAAQLEEKNTERQRVTEAILDVARRQAEGQAEANKVLLLVGDDWAPGVVGLVASRLVDEFSRPVLVMNRGETDSHGSARSIAAFNIIGALDNCKDLLIRYGGHSQAAGLTLSNLNLEGLSERLICLADQELQAEDLQPEIRIDAEISLRDVTWKTHRELDELGPFGAGNPAPVFVTYGAKLLEARPVGAENQHLRLKMHDTRGGRILEAIGFGMGPVAEELERAVSVDIVYSLEAREWNGNRSLQLKLRDVRPAG